MNDLKLAASSMTPEGVVILDDCFNSAWPEVSWAFADYLRADDNWVPFAITPNKVFLCRPDYATRYTGMLTERFSSQVEKRARLHGHPVTIMGVEQRTMRSRLARTPIGALLRKLLGRVPRGVRSAR